eukprot:143884-Rhodomonas_salina.1
MISRDPTKLRRSSFPLVPNHERFRSGMSADHARRCLKSHSRESLSQIERDESNKVPYISPCADTSLAYQNGGIPLRNTSNVCLVTNLKENLNQVVMFSSANGMQPDARRTNPAFGQNGAGHNAVNSSSPRGSPQVRIHVSPHDSFRNIWESLVPVMSGDVQNDVSTLRQRSVLKNGSGPPQGWFNPSLFFYID